MSEVDKRAYCNYLNGELRGVPELKSVLPINPSSDDFYKVVSQGLLLSKYIAKNWSNFKDIEPTHTATLSAAKQLGITLGITEEDLENAQENTDIVIEFIWQLIKQHLFKVKESEDLKRVLEPGEKLALLPFETLLLRWFNFHLTNHGHHRTVNNFTTDIKDAENYAVLFAQVAPDTVTPDALVEAFKEKNFLTRAELVLRWAAKLGCRKFVTPQDIIDGNKNLNSAFLACVFHRYPALGPTSSEIAKELENRVSEIESLLAETFLDKEDIESQITQTKLDFDSLALELGDFQLEFDTIDAERSLLQQEKTSLESLFNDLNSENQGLLDELTTLTTEKDDLFAELEKEMSMKLDLETLLRETKEEFESVKTQSETKISDLQKQLESEISESKTISSRLESTLVELEKMKTDSVNVESELQTKLQSTISQRADLESKVASSKGELNDTILLAEEAEKTKDDLFKLLTDTINELETTKEKSKFTAEELRQTLKSENAKKDAAHKALQAKIQEYETALANWKIERDGLLKRIEELETEIENLRDEMAAKLEAIAAAKAEALAKALAERERALAEAENEKDMALDKVRMLLTGNTKQGYMHLYTETLVGMQWKKRFFVLRDNLLAWYHKEKHVTTQKPSGVCYCEDARMYELPFDETKREYAFQIVAGNVKINIAAESLEEMKEWMTEIRVAKKKKLGVKVVSETKSGSKSKK